jgi:hypothetical protein
MRKDGREAEMARRLVVRVVPLVAAREPVQGRQQRERPAAVAALEQAGGLRSDQQAAVSNGDVRHFRQLQVAVGIADALARVLPRLAEIGAPPDGRAVPLARCSGEDGARALVVDRVVDRPAFAIRAPELPFAPILATLEDEAPFPRTD